MEPVMEPLDAIAAASSTFVAVLDQVPSDQLGAATPCEEWDVRELLAHVIVGSHMAVALLDGASADEAKEFWGQTFGDDIVDVCRESVDVQLDRVNIVSDWDAAVHHVVGDMPASRLLGFRTSDLTLHAWDLATAFGIDDGIADDLAADVYVSLAPMAPFIGDTGMFGSGPSGAVGDDATVKDRLLDLAGRRP
ncbi:MAG TPA: TIGR03086 family metal-binding protein [Acidimicrobiales bacterium]